MSEEFIKNNDYTISVVEREAQSDSAGYTTVYMTSSLTRTFNFLSAQLTTRTCDRVFQSRGGDAGGSAAVSSQTIIENFYDLPSTGEVELMHAKLVEMGGKPPALESVLGRLNKKSNGIPRSGN